MSALSSFTLRKYIAALSVVALASAMTAAAATPGTLLWEAKPGPRDFGPPVEASGVVVTGNITGEGGLYAFSAETGKLLWKSRGGQSRGKLASDGQHLFA